jgi:two-component sensor histidine kinase
MRLENLKTFMKKIGGDESLKLEQRIFNISSFSISVFALVGTIANYLTGLNFTVIFLSFIGFIVTFSLFYLSRFKNKYSAHLIIYYLISMGLILGTMFFFNAGVNGTVTYLILMFLNIFVLIVSEKKQNLIYLFFYLLLVSLIALNYAFPNLITKYNSNEEAFADHAITMLYTMFFTTYIIATFRKKMSEDRKVIISKSNELETLYEEISTQKTALHDTADKLKIALEKTNERNKYIETLIKELSHRVKNNLQLVISLLDMQSMNISDSKSKEAINDAKNRLLSMLLAHQKLYNIENAVSIYIPDYLNQLTEMIQTTYRESYDECFEINCIPIRHEVEKVISLGLIINEIITNSFKHAFKETENPLIKITITQINQTNILTISDNGSGFEKKENYNGMGLSIVKALTKQLHGNFEIKKTIESKSGTTSILKWPV